MGVKITNNAAGTLNAAITSTDTALTLTSGQGALFPTLASGDYCWCTLVNTANDVEVIKVTARSTDTLTMTRGQDNTTARAFAINDRLELRPTAALFAEFANPEGTVIKSTGETGGTKFLREDGDNTSSWQTVPAGGATALDGLSDVTTTGSSVAVGSTNAGDTGSFNTALGKDVMNNNVSGYRNTALGYGVLAANTTGYHNVAVGMQSLDANNTGHLNVAVGYDSLGANTSGLTNTAVGYRTASASTTAENVVAVGYDALKLNTASNNTGVGTNALSSNVGGTHNSAFAHNALKSNTTGTENTAIGREAMKYSTSGHSNVAVGYIALDTATTASNNTAVGAKSLETVTSGGYNTAIGYGALRNSTAAGNTAVGEKALYYNTNGVDNIGIGREVGAFGSNLTTGDNNVFIGNYAHGPDADSNHSLVLGYNVGGSNSTFTFGNASSDTRCSHGSTSWSTPSDERYKKDITDATAGLGFVNDLRPVTYNWKNEGDLPTDHTSYVEGSTVPFNNRTETQHGFIAQEVKATIDAHTEIKEGFDMWAEDTDGRQRLGETALIPMLVKAIQELSAKVEALENA